MFGYNGDNEKIKNAVKIANDIGLIGYICEQIMSHGMYDYSNVTSEYISQSLKEFIFTSAIEIRVYYPKWKYSKAIGYYSSSEPNIININGYKVLDIEQMVSNFHHENCHAWNDWNPITNVHHNGNSSVGKENTLHYSVNRYVYEYLNYEPNKYKPSLLRRIFNFLVGR